MIRTFLSFAYSLPSIFLPARISARFATPMLLKDANISLSFVAARYLSFFPRLRGVSHVLSRNSFCEIRIAGFVRNARAGDLRGSLSQRWSLCRISALIMRAFRDAIRDNCTLPCIIAWFATVFDLWGKRVSCFLQQKWHVRSGPYAANGCIVDKCNLLVVGSFI